jgi:putative ABC transport system permease protein
MLGIRPGDLITIEVLEGERPIRRVPVVGLVREFVGVSAYMRLDALNRLLREGPSISGVYLTADRPARPRILDELRDMPRVAGAAMRENTLKNFYEIMGRQTLIFAFINTLLRRLSRSASSTTPRGSRCLNGAASWPACACSGLPEAKSLTSC